MYRSKSSVFEREMALAPYDEVIVVVVRVNDEAGERSSDGGGGEETDVVPTPVATVTCRSTLESDSSFSVCVLRVLPAAVVRLSLRAAALCEVGTGRRTIG